MVFCFKNKLPNVRYKNSYPSCLFRDKVNVMTYMCTHVQKGLHHVSIPEHGGWGVQTHYRWRRLLRGGSESL